MKLVLALAIWFLLVMPSTAEAGDLLVDDGETNPEEQTLKYFSEKYDFKFARSTACI